MFAIPVALLIVGGGLAALRNGQGALLAAILLANWALCAGFWWATGMATGWIALAAFDYVAALAVAIGVSVSRPMLAIVMLYAGMLLCHAAYGIGGSTMSASAYFAALTYLAWGQVAVLGGWLAVGAYRMVRDRANPRSGLQPDPVVPKS